METKKHRLMRAFALSFSLLLAFGFGASVAAQTEGTNVLDTYQGPGEDVVISDTLGITEIGSNAFQYNTDIVSIRIPEGVIAIDDYAFSGCSNLTSITLPNSLETIGEGAFYGCSSLTSISIPEEVKAIENYTFSGCSSLISITLPDSLESIGYTAFSGCSSLTSFSIPEKVTTIDYYTFDGCSNLLSVVIPNSVEIIGYNAFSDCSSLTSITIPNSVKTIGYGAFYGCSSLTSVSIPHGATAIDPSAFGSCSNLSMINVDPENANYSSENGTLYSKDKKILYMYPGGKTDKLFIIPSSVETISSNALSNEKLNAVVIPENVTDIEDYAFSFSNIKNITVYWQTPIDLPWDVFRWFDQSDCNLYVPAGTLDDYRYATGWQDFNIKEQDDYPDYDLDLNREEAYLLVNDSVQLIATLGPANASNLNISWDSDDESVATVASGLVTALSKGTAIITAAAEGDPSTNRSCIVKVVDKEFIVENHVLINYIGSGGDVVIPDGLEITEIGILAFYSNNSILSIRIPEGVTSIGAFAFFHCSNLTSITLPNSMKTIGENAFSNCVSLTSIAIPKKVTAINNYTFENCSNLTFVTIPKSVESIGYKAFSACSSLTSITLPKSLKSIGKNAFAGCSSLPSIAIPKKVTAIDDFTFADCSSLTSIAIPNSVITIGERAFTGCSSLTSVTIPEKVTAINKYTFAGCSSLASATISNSVETIGKKAFTGCSALTSITLPNALKTIGEEAFSSCYGLTSLVIPEKVTAIGDAAFFWCLSLASIKLPNSLETIEEIAFAGCFNLTSVVIPEKVTSINPYTFAFCSGLTSVKLPNSLASIEEGTFYGCSGLTSIDIPKTVSKIDPYAFVNCYKLSAIQVDPVNPTYLSDNGTVYSKDKKTFYLYPAGKTAGTFIIPNSIERVSRNAFSSGNDNLKSVVIPENVSDIENDLFAFSNSLKNLTVYWQKPLELSDSVFNNFDPSGCNLYVPVGTVDDYQNAPGWQDFNIEEQNESPYYSIELDQKAAYMLVNHTLQLNATVGPANASNKNVRWSSEDQSVATVASGLVTAVSNGTVDIAVVADGNPNVRTTCRLTVVDKAFVVDEDHVLVAYLGSDNNVIIPDNLGIKEIGSSAFTSNNDILSIRIPEGVTAIDAYAFTQCSNLTSVIIPNSVETIGYGAFNDCSSLTSIAIPPKVRMIDIFTFSGCSALTSITLPNSIETIGEEAFNNCYSLTSIVIPNSVKMIGYRTFYGCSSLTSVVIPEKVTKIDASAFAFCSSLNSLTLPNSVETIGEGAFYGCSRLNSVVIPEKISMIGASAFGGCSRLSEINVDAENAVYSSENGSLYSKGKKTLYLYPGGKTASAYIIPSSVETISSTSFSGGNTNLNAIVIPDNVTAIEDGAFTDLELKSITVYWRNPINISDNVFPWYDPSDCSLYVPVGALDDYNKASVWQDFSVEEQDESPDYAVELDQAEAYLLLDHTLQLTATVGPPNASNFNVSWNSSDPSVAAVASSGLVTGISKGTATITAASEGDPAITAACQVNVSDTEFVVVNDTLTTYLGAGGHVVIPDNLGIKAIGSTAFSFDRTILSISIPKDITAIDDYAFAFCVNLTDVYVYWKEPITLSPNSAIFYGIDSGFNLHVPTGCEKAYKEAAVWKDFSIKVDQK